MTEQQTGRPAPDGTQRDDQSAHVTGEAKATRPLHGAAKPDAETREAVREAIDRATAPVGHDDGKR